MEVEDERMRFNKIETIQLYYFLQKQSIATIINSYWLYERLEKERALSFIRSHGLFAKYTASKN